MSSAGVGYNKREFVSSGAPEDPDVAAAASKKCCLMNLCTMEPMTSLPEGDQFGRSRDGRRSDFKSMLFL